MLSYPPPNMQQIKYYIIKKRTYNICYSIFVNVYKLLWIGTKMIAINGSGKYVHTEWLISINIYWVSKTALKNYKYSFCLMVEASDHVYVWPQAYTYHRYSFTYRLYFLPANPCDTYKSAVRHIHDPMLVP